MTNQTRKDDFMRDNCFNNKHLDTTINYYRWNYKQTFTNGLKNGIKTTWLLTKIIVPVYFFVTFLKYAHVLEIISRIFHPIMKFVGLPGEAAIVLVLGNTVNLFAAVGGIAGLTLTSKQITIIAVMLSFSHSLFMETAVAKKTGISVKIVLGIRFVLAIASGIVLNILL